MAKTSAPPPPPASGGNLKYVLIGLLFLGAAGAVFWLGRPQPAAPPAPTAAPAPEPERVNPLAAQDLDLEPEEPEPTEAQAPEPPKPTGPAKPKVPEWDCSGDLAGANAVISENRGQIRNCYERRLKVNNLLQGELRLKLKVGATGKVVATSVTGSMRDSEVLTCVRSLASNWTFGVPTGGTCAVLQVPFSFSPKQ